MPTLTHVAAVYLHICELCGWDQVDLILLVFLVQCLVYRHPKNVSVRDCFYQAYARYSALAPLFFIILRYNFCTAEYIIYVQLQFLLFIC